MTPLIWTDAKPTAPGWYFWRIDATVTEPSDWEAIYWPVHGRHSKVGQFAGPIPMPVGSTEERK